MADFLDLQNRVQYYLKRNAFYDASGNNITTTALGLFVNFALQQIQRFIPVKQAIETNWTISIGPGNHPYQVTSLTAPQLAGTSLTGTFRYGYDLWVSSAGAGVTPMAALKRYMSIKQFHDDFPPTDLGIGGIVTASAPMGWVMYGTPMAITLGPPPDVTYTFSLDGTQWLPPLVQSTDTNWYTLNADDALTYLACKEAAVWLQEDQLIQQFDALAQQKIKDVLRSFREEEVSDETVLVGNLLG